MDHPLVQRFHDVEQGADDVAMSHRSIGGTGTSVAASAPSHGTRDRPRAPRAELPEGCLRRHDRATRTAGDRSDLTGRRRSAPRLSDPRAPAAGPEVRAEPAGSKSSGTIRPGRSRSDHRGEQRAPGGASLRLSSTSRPMRRPAPRWRCPGAAEDHVAEPEQRLGAPGSLANTSRPAGAEPAVHQRVDQRRLVDHRAARHVDRPARGPRPHHLAADQAVACPPPPCRYHQAVDRARQRDQVTP